MSVRIFYFRIVLCVVCLIAPLQAATAGPKAPLVRSTLAIVDSVKADSLAAKSSIQPGDAVVELNGKKTSSLEEVLAYRYDWGNAKDSCLGLKHGKAMIQAKLPQGDWGCEFRADLSEDPLKRLNEAREALRKADAWQEGQKAWEALAEEARKEGCLEVVHWLRLELGKALNEGRHWQEAQAVLSTKGMSEKSYWAFAATLQGAIACKGAGENDRAAENYKRAKDLVKANGSEIRIAAVLMEEFIFERRRGRLSEAKKVIEEALYIHERLAPNSLAMAKSLGMLGIVVKIQGNLASAREYYLKALAIQERLAPNSLSVASNLNNLGNIAADHADLIAAREYYRKTLVIQERLAPNSLDMAGTLNNLGTVASDQDDLASARDFYLKALTILEHLAPDSLNVAGILNNLGIVAYSQGDLASAREYHHKALAISERLAPNGLDATTSLGSLGNVAYSQGDLASAREYQLKALAINERLAPNSLNVANSLANLGNVAGVQGDLTSAREYQLKALAIHERLVPNSLHVANSLSNLGTVVIRQGDLTAAREYYLKALAIQERLAPKGLAVAYSLNGLGNVASDQGDLTAAREYHLKALAIREHLAPNSLDVAASLNNLGIIAMNQSNLTSAREYHLKALAIKERLASNSLDVASSLDNLGIVARNQADPAAAREYHLKAVAIRERLAPGSLDLATSLRDLSKIEKSSGNFPRYVDLLTKAVNTLEIQRSKAGGESAKTSFSTAHEDFYTDLLAAYLDTKKPEQALETLERSRARTLLEMVSSRYIDLKVELPEDLLVKQRELSRQRKLLSDKLSKADNKTSPKDIDAWRSELLMLPQKEDALAEAIRKASPRLAALQYPKPLDFKGMQGALKPGTLMVALAVAEKETYLFTLRKPVDKAKSKITPKTKDFQAIRLPLGTKELENRIRAFRTTLSAQAAFSRDSGAWKKAARELYASLLAPVSNEIAECDRMVILADGPLHLLPFSVLLPAPTKGKHGLRGTQPLGLQRSISSQASMTIYAGLHTDSASAKPSGSASWSGMGDPVYPSNEKPGEIRGELASLNTRGFDLRPLPGTRVEIEGIARLFGQKALVRLGPDATKEALLKLPKGMPYIHFACHGLIDSDFPMNSALALSPSVEKESGRRNDGLLQAWEIIQDVKLNTDCVVLSACQTGVGKVYGGEGILGLTRAFFYAGAKSVVVTLWPIADQSTATFMQAFYQEILAGAPRDLALQRAQAKLCNSAAYSHPFFWAAFTLVGAEK